MRLFNYLWHKPFVAGAIITTGLITFVTTVIHTLSGMPLTFFLGVPLLAFLALALDRYFCRVPIKFNMKVLSCLLFYPLCFYRRWDRVTKNLYIGALPLKKHLAELVEQEKISSVLSMTEQFELETGGFFFKPVSKHDWLQEGVHHEVIEAKDCTMLSETHIEKAVRFIAQEIKKGRKVYVHCQAGIERSVTVAAAYLIHAGIAESIRGAIVHLKKFRPNAILTKRNEHVLKSWFENHRKPKGLMWLYEKAYQKFLELKKNLLK